MTETNEKCKVSNMGEDTRGYLITKSSTVVESGEKKGPEHACWGYRKTLRET